MAAEGVLGSQKGVRAVVEHWDGLLFLEGSTRG